MEKANILVMGNSGAGKSTLINAVLDNKVAKTSLGDRGTQKMDIYETDTVPFRLIDSKGMEYGFISQISTKMQIEKWTKDNLSETNKDKCVNMIWYCVDAMSARLFKENVRMLKSVTKYWKSVPVIVVLTKSYSDVMKKDNEAMVRDQLAKYGKGVNVYDVISVVASFMPIDEVNVVPQSGVDTLIDRTIKGIPDALKMTDAAIADYQLKVKNNAAHGLTVTASSGAAVVAAVPIPIADTLVLVPMQTALVQAIAKIYGLKSEDKQVVSTIVECGTVSAVAKTSLSALKAVLPGVGSVLNAIVACVFTAAVGEISIYIMQQIYTGERSSEDIDWIKKYSESELKKQIDTVLPFLTDIDKKVDITDIKSVIKFVTELLMKVLKK